jgi:hypothetical protein
MLRDQAAPPVTWAWVGLGGPDWAWPVLFGLAVAFPAGYTAEAVRWHKARIFSVDFAELERAKNCIILRVDTALRSRSVPSTQGGVGLNSITGAG